MMRNRVAPPGVADSIDRPLQTMLVVARGTSAVFGSTHQRQIRRRSDQQAPRVSDNAALSRRRLAMMKG